MAKVSIYLNSEVREEGKPLVDAMQLLADAIEGFFGYKLGDPDIHEQNLKAMLWTVAHVSGLVAKERPHYEFGYSDEQDAELMKLVDGSPYPLITSCVG